MLNTSTMPTVKYLLTVTVLLFASVARVGLAAAITGHYGHQCTFTETKGYMLHGNDDLIVQRIPLSDCQDYCAGQTQPPCLSLEYDGSERCYLSMNSNRTKPMDFTQNPTTDYYENVCTRDLRPPSDAASTMQCPPAYFACQSNYHTCIPDAWRCDNFADCRDESDELQCPAEGDGKGGGQNGGGSDNGMFVCLLTGQKIPEVMYCDGRQDCSDNSDEDGCVVDEEEVAPSSLCDDDEFQCEEGAGCQPESWICDGQRDCENGVDEAFCEEEEEVNVAKCEFYCSSKGRGRCIANAQVCDGIQHCGNGADERDCMTSCNPRVQFACKEQVEPFCIPKFFTCDGVDDCRDGSDEEDCEGGTSCTPAQFQCANGRECEFLAWVCDSEADCEDGSDEVGCSARNCSSQFQFACGADGPCIPTLWRCDQEKDCADGSDEKDCDSRLLCDPEFEFTCKQSGACVIHDYVCDGDRDCSDGSDEANCAGDCDWASEFACRSDSKCIAKEWVCDSRSNCQDGSDEEDCDT